ncbi:hypothetical protein [Maridesulfovibrio sp.]|uniref:hypothetical protein n=1 Tax=Maridesulfovibrio sp. TaxID=2795000 RepID=UPI003B00EEE2
MLNLNISADHVFSDTKFFPAKAEGSLGGARNSIGTCMICETPVYVDEGSLQDVDGNVWHMECDGEISWSEGGGL